MKSWKKTVFVTKTKEFGVVSNDDKTNSYLSQFPYLLNCPDALFFCLTESLLRGSCCLADGRLDCFLCLKPCRRPRHFHLLRLWTNSLIIDFSWCITDHHYRSMIALTPGHVYKTLKLTNYCPLNHSLQKCCHLVTWIYFHLFEEQVVPTIKRIVRWFSPACFDLCEISFRKKIVAANMNEWRYFSV